jgi:rhodanese-related sulfurtransferase
MFNFFNTTPSVSPQDVSQRVGNDSVGFIDVRSTTEFKNGHAQGARNIPLETIAARTEALKDFSEVYVICASGGRSARAVNHLLTQGVNAFNVSGGTIAWQSMGLPMK